MSTHREGKLRRAHYIVLALSCAVRRFIKHCVAMAVGPVTETVERGGECSKRHPAGPQRAKCRSVPSRYVGALSDARTKLEAFFNILLGLTLTVYSVSVAALYEKDAHLDR